MLIERSDALDDLAAQERRGGVCAIPQCVARKRPGLARPVPGAAPRGVGGTAGEPVEIRARGEAPCDALEEVVWVRAVVVGERHDVGVDARQCRVSRASQAAWRVQAHGVEIGARRDDRHDPVVVVLVDEQHPEAAVGLALERVEQNPQAVAAVDRRDDESEGREVGILHRA